MESSTNTQTREWLSNIKKAFSDLLTKVKEHDEYVEKIEQSDKAVITKKNDSLQKDFNTLQIEYDDLEDESRKKERELRKELSNALTKVETTTKELDNSKISLKKKDDNIAELSKSLTFIKEILSATIASDSGTKSLYKKIQDIVDYIEGDFYDCIKHLRILKLVNKTIDDKYFKEYLHRWAVSEKKNWIKNKTTVAFVGEFTSGKTSIINLILTNGQRGVDLLSVDNSVTTAIPTYISNGEEERYRFFSADEKLKEISKGTFYSIDKRIINKIGSLSSLVKYFVMTYNNPELTKVSILDTPGFCSNDEEDSRRTISVIKECDALFWVIDVNLGEISKSSIKILKDNLKKPLYIVINKIDTMSIESVQLVKDKIIKTLKANNITYERIILFSKETSDIKDILVIIKNIKHIDEQDNYLLHLLNELTLLINELETQVFNCHQRLNEKNIELIKIRSSFENSLTSISDACDDTSNLPTLQERIFRSDYYKLTKEQYHAFSEHISSIQKQVNNASELFTTMSHAETAKESYNSQYTKTNSIMQELIEIQNNLKTRKKGLYNE